MKQQVFTALRAVLPLFVGLSFSQLSVGGATKDGQDFVSGQFSWRSICCL